MTEQSYLNLMQEIMEHGVKKPNRTGIDTLSLFGKMLTFDLQAGFPLLTTKKVFFKGVVHELLWLVSGSTNVKDLQKHGVTIWDEWADLDGELGPVYGKQWRKWKQNPVLRQKGEAWPLDYSSWISTPGIKEINWVWRQDLDQIAQVIHNLKTNPFGRRHLVTAWNPSDIPEMALPPCHYSFQFNCRPINGLTRDPNKNYPQFYLDCLFNMRSADFFLGVPFNIASYATLTHMIAKLVHMFPGQLTLSLGDVHIYTNHLEQCHQQLQRSPKPLPQIKIKRVPETIDDYKFEDFELVDYHPHPAILAPIAV